MKDSAAKPQASAFGSRARRRSRARGGILFKLVALVAALAAFVVLAWMLFLPTLVTQQIRARTGFDATLAKLACNPFAGMINLKDLVVTNPPTFPVKEFVHLKSFSAKAERLSLASNPLVFETMDVDLGNVTLIRRLDGSSNSGAFERNLAEFADDRPRPPSSTPPRGYLVKKLRIRVSQLTVIDYVRREQRKRVYKLDIDQAYVDVTSLSQIVEPKTLAALEPVALVARDLLPSGLRDAIDEALKPAAALLQEHRRELSNKSAGFFDALEESKKP